MSIWANSLLFKVLEHFFFDIVHFAAYNEGVHGLTHVSVHEWGHSAADDRLCIRRDSCQADARSVCIVAWLSCLLTLFLGLFALFRCLQKLLSCTICFHVTWWHVNGLPSGQALNSRFFNFYVEQAESMQARLPILFYLFVKTIGTPFLCKKWDRNNLSKTINLQATAAHGRDYRSIWYDFNLHSLLDAA